LSVAVAVIASHILLPFSRFSWRSKGLLSVSAAIIAGLVLHGFGPLHRAFDLYHANLSSQWLSRDDLRNANLRYANLSSATLEDANLSDADLFRANLASAILIRTNLSSANLEHDLLAPSRTKGTKYSVARGFSSSIRCSSQPK